MFGIMNTVIRMATRTEPRRADDIYADPPSRESDRDEIRRAHEALARKLHYRGWW